MLISINKISIKKVYYSEIVGLTLFIVISIWILALSISALVSNRLGLFLLKEYGILALSENALL